MSLAPDASAQTGWTDERMEVLKRMWTEGFSGAQIAKKLGGITRNAVIGKIHRLGLAARAKPSAPAKVGVRVRAKVARRPRSSDTGRAVATTKLRPLPPPRREPPPVVSVENARPWITRAFGECAYPVAGEGADTFSCCAPCGEATYCKAHRAVMVNPIQPKCRDTNRLARWAA